MSHRDDHHCQHQHSDSNQSCGRDADCRLPLLTEQGPTWAWVCQPHAMQLQSADQPLDNLDLADSDHAHDTNDLRRSTIA